MKCPKCGAENLESAAFCTLCFWKFTSGIESSDPADSQAISEPAGGEVDQELKRRLQQIKGIDLDEKEKFMKFLETGKISSQTKTTAKIVKYLILTLMVVSMLGSLLWMTTFSSRQLTKYGPALQQAKQIGNLNQLMNNAGTREGQALDQPPAIRVSPKEMEKAVCFAVLQSAAISIMRYGAENDGNFSGMTADVLMRDYQAPKAFKDGSPVAGDENKICIEDKDDSNFTISIIGGSGTVYVAKGQMGGTLEFSER